jgi:hypothetical protein
MPSRSRRFPLGRTLRYRFKNPLDGSKAGFRLIQRNRRLFFPTPPLVKPFLNPVPVGNRGLRIWLRAWEPIVKRS